MLRQKFLRNEKRATDKKLKDKYYMLKLEGKKKVKPKKEMQLEFDFMK